MAEDSFIIDSVTEIKGGLRFNLLYLRDFGKGPVIYFAVLGLRLISGCIYPPSIFAKGRYFETIVCGQDCSERIYEALAAKVNELGLGGKYKLVSKEWALDGLVNRNKLTRNFPSVVDNMGPV